MPIKELRLISGKGNPRINLHLVFQMGRKYGHIRVDVQDNTNIFLHGKLLKSTN